MGRLILRKCSEISREHSFHLSPPISCIQCMVRPVFCKSPNGYLFGHAPLLPGNHYWYNWRDDVDRSRRGPWHLRTSPSMRSCCLCTGHPSHPLVHVRATLTFKLSLPNSLMRHSGQGAVFLPLLSWYINKVWKHWRHPEWPHGKVTGLTITDLLKVPKKRLSFFKNVYVENFALLLLLFFPYQEKGTFGLPLIPIFLLYIILWNKIWNSYYVLRL